MSLHRAWNAGSQTTSPLSRCGRQAREAWRPPRRPENSPSRRRSCRLARSRAVRRLGGGGCSGLSTSPAAEAATPSGVSMGRPVEIAAVVRICRTGGSHAMQRLGRRPQSGRAMDPRFTASIFMVATKPLSASERPRGLSMITLSSCRILARHRRRCFSNNRHRDIRTFGQYRLHSTAVNPLSSLRAHSGPRAGRRTSGSQLRR
jgi:hypothetical protein